MSEQEYIDLAPSPSALMESLRDIGYSMQTAIADIIDNSITAQSTEINLRFSWNEGNPWLGIIDNGHGMSRDELIAAMRFGSLTPRADRSVDDLGRFGLGMKTASFSQCRHLTVLSKKDGTLTCCEWDLDLISLTKNSKWLLHVLSEDELLKKTHLLDLMNTYLKNIQSGTIVLWKKIDRIDREVSESQQEAHLNSLVSDARHHLELVFHRYLAPEVGRKKIKISLNGMFLEAFDPFNTGHITTIELPDEYFECDGHKISVQPFVLPHHRKVDKEQYQLYAGKEGYVHNQGFYVYRNKRLIIKGTWFRLIKKSELTKLVRVRIDIPNTLDHLWKIDVKKSNASPPESIRSELKRIISKIEYSGKRVYMGRGERLKTLIKDPVWSRRVASGHVIYEINRDHPLLRKFFGNIGAEKSVVFSDLLKMIESSFPSDLFFSDFANAPEKLNRAEFKEEQLGRLLEVYIELWGLNSDSSEEEIDNLLEVDPFLFNKEIALRLLAQKGIAK